MIGKEDISIFLFLVMEIGMNGTEIQSSYSNMEEETDKLLKPEEQEFFCEKCQRSCTLEISLTWLPKHDLNKDDVSRHANMRERKLTRF